MFPQSSVHRSKASPSIGCFCRVSNVCICIYNHNCISVSICLYLSYVSAVQRAQVHSFSINWMFLPRFFSSQQMLTSQPSFTKGGGATFLSFFFFPKLSANKSPVFLHNVLPCTRWWYIVWGEKTSQDVQMRSMSLSDCLSRTIGVMMQISQLIRNSQLCHWIARKRNSVTKLKSQRGDFGNMDFSSHRKKLM